MSAFTSIYPGLRANQLGLRANQLDHRANQPDHRALKLGLRASQPGLRASQPDLLDGWMHGEMDGCREFLPILQDFIPYQGRCPV